MKISHLINPKKCFASAAWMGNLYVCPKCGSSILKRKSKRGYAYYACERGAACGFMSWDVPTESDCPVCGQTMFKRSGKGFKRPFCINPACANFLPEEKRAKTLLHDIPAAFFEKGCRYRILVTPVGFFGNEGKPLAAEVTASAPLDDVEKVVLDVRDPGGKYPAVTAVLGNERTETKDGWFSNFGRLDLPRTIWEAPKGTRFRCVVDIETEAGEPDSFILGFVHPSPLQYQGRVRTPSGAPGKRRYVFEFARWDEGKFYSFYTQGGPGRIRLDRIVISRLKGKDS